MIDQPRIWSPLRRGVGREDLNRAVIESEVETHGVTSPRCDLEAGAATNPNRSRRREETPPSSTRENERAGETLHNLDRCSLADDCRRCHASSRSNVTESGPSNSRPPSRCFPASARAVSECQSTLLLPCPRNRSNTAANRARQWCKKLFELPKTSRILLPMVAQGSHLEMSAQRRFLFAGLVGDH